MLTKALMAKDKAEIERVEHLPSSGTSFTQCKMTTFRILGENLAISAMRSRGELEEKINGSRSDPGSKGVMTY
jgi:hypothetical protein